MAIDTVQKRESAIHVGLPFRGLLPIPDGAVGQPDRQHVPGWYSGITATVNRIDHYGAKFTVLQYYPTRTLNLSSYTLNNLADFLGTLIADYEDGTYDGTAWTLTNLSVLYYAEYRASMDEIARVMASYVNYYGGSVFGRPRLAEVLPTDGTPDWTYWATTTTIDEVWAVFRTLTQIVPWYPYAAWDAWIDRTGDWNAKIDRTLDATVSI